jgi:RNA polymerase sigma-70 factor, ECF subfamily
MTETEDQKLINQYLAGDEQSLEILIKLYLKPIYGFAYRIVNHPAEAEDITQEVFLRVWKKIKKLDPQKNFKSWIFTIAKNASIDYLKKKKTLTFSAFEQEDGGNTILDSLADPEPLPDELFERSDLVTLLDSTLKKISLPYRLVLQLYYFEHFNFREIAEVLNEPLNTIKSRHRRALIKLKEILDKSQ